MTFANNPALGSVYINGPDVDLGRLLVNLDYTLAGNDVVLNSSYPAGTVITLIYSDFTGSTDATEFLRETVSLTAGQVDVTFSNDVANGAFYITGPAVDGKRLFPITDLTITGVKSITLDESYPEDTVLSLVYHNDIDNVQASQAASIEYINNQSVTDTVQDGLVAAEDDIDALEASSAANATTVSGLLTSQSSQDTTITDHETRITALEAPATLSIYESAEIGLPGTGVENTVSHGLGSRPRLFWAVLRCKIAQHGYAVDDEVAIDAGVRNDGEEDGIQVWASSTQLGVISGNRYPITIYNSVGNAVELTTANWRVVVRAIA